MIYNFNVCRSNGKTYYEMNKSWKDIKKRIKIILDEPQKCRYEKIIEIVGMLEMYNEMYLKEGTKK